MFADSRTATGDLIVGCEGVRSYRREALVGKDAATNELIDIKMSMLVGNFPPM
jgi:2-polyprenyl-6-methoxyphenol hydroxylase-like FAD-dependent oxidoreductase